MSGWQVVTPKRFVCGSFWIYPSSFSYQTPEILPLNFLSVGSCPTVDLQCGDHFLSLHAQSTAPIYSSKCPKKPPSWTLSDICLHHKHISTSLLDFPYFPYLFFHIDQFLQSFSCPIPEEEMAFPNPKKPVNSVYLYFFCEHFIILLSHHRILKQYKNLSSS